MTPGTQESDVPTTVFFFFMKDTDEDQPKDETQG